MRNFAYFILSTILILVCADLSAAQRVKVDSDLKERMRDKQRAYEAPANNPF